MNDDSHFNFSILIVDDDPTDLEALKNILRPTYTLYFAKSGKTALEKSKKNRPDLILLDVVMSDMDGFEVLSKLKESGATHNIPVIFITGLNGVEDEEKGFHLGAIDYITKPFHSSIVKARIRSHLTIMNQIREKDDASIMIKTRQEVRNVLFRELVYVDVQGHWLNFHLTNDMTVKVYATMKEYEDALLGDPRFARCHRSFIINMDYVDVVEVRDVVLKNNMSLPISKRHMDFKKTYSRWVNG